MCLDKRFERREQRTVSVAGSAYKRTQLALFLSLLIGCGQVDGMREDVGGRRALLSQIDGSVRLPNGAEPFRRYSRYYSPTADGNIAVLYVIHDRAYVDAVNAFCRNGTVDHFPCRPDSNASQLAAAGHRKWLDNPKDMPAPDGGGCAAITFTYFIDERRASAPQCNDSY